MLNKEPRWAKPKFHGLKCDIHKVEDPCERSEKGQGVKVQLLKKCQVKRVEEPVYRVVLPRPESRHDMTPACRVKSPRPQHRHDMTPSCRVANRYPAPETT